MASLAVRLRTEAVRTVGFAAIVAASPAFLGIGTVVTAPVRMIFLQNLTDALLMFSFNGIDDTFPLAPNGYIILDIAANQTFNQGFFLAENQRIYVKQSGGTPAPTSGDVYLTVFYGAD